MKTIANRIIVIAASVIALGTVAYGQTTMTAEIPFAFRAASATLPAGTYTFDTSSGIAHSVVIRNAATQRHVRRGRSGQPFPRDERRSGRRVHLCGEKLHADSSAVAEWIAGICRAVEAEEV